MRLMGNPRRRRPNARGQALVEFSLVIMIFMTIVVAIMEFSFVLTTKIGVTDSAQDAVQLAAQIGTNDDADFYILQIVEKDMSAPIDRSKIVSVTIFRTDEYGTANYGQDKYNHGGSLPNQDATATVPYSPAGLGYVPADRCNVVSGAGCTHTGGVDYIGVTIQYQYSWVTPLPNLVGLGTSPPLFVQTSVSRMEPIQ
jgi:TadE-like protein